MHTLTLTSIEFLYSTHSATDLLNSCTTIPHLTPTNCSTYLDSQSQKHKDPNSYTIQMHKPTPSTIPISPTMFSVNDVQDSDPLHSTKAELSYSNNPLLALQPQSQAYQYMDHLRALDSYRPNNRRMKPPDYLSQVVTPLKLEAWAQALAQHPDHAFRSYVLQGIAQGFRIGFNYNAIATCSATSNMPSAYANPQPVSDYMETEIKAGRVIGPLRSDVAQSIQISRFGVIPKRNKPGRCRLILDLSSPPGYSVNDGISSDYAPCPSPQ